MQHVDLVPTVLDLAKAPIPGNLDGRPLTPLLDGEHFARRMIYSESLFGTYHFGLAPLQTLSDGRFRYVTGAREELFDLRPSDAGEIDVSSEHPEVVAAMREALRKLAVPAPKPDAAVSAADRTRLEEAGYVGFRVPGTPLTAIDASADASDQIRIIEDYRVAVRAAAARQWFEATERLRALARQVPDVADLWLHLGAAAARAERHDLALDAYRRALDLEPELVNARLLAGFELVRQRKGDEAAALAESALTLAPAIRRSARAVTNCWRGWRCCTVISSVRARRRRWPRPPIRSVRLRRSSTDASLTNRAATKQRPTRSNLALAAVAKTRAELPADFRYFARGYADACGSDAGSGISAARRGSRLSRSTRGRGRSSRHSTDRPAAPTTPPRYSRRTQGFSTAEHAETQRIYVDSASSAFSAVECAGYLLVLAGWRFFRSFLSCGLTLKPAFSACFTSSSASLNRPVMHVDDGEVVVRFAELGVHLDRRFPGAFRRRQSPSRKWALPSDSSTSAGGR